MVKIHIAIVSKAEYNEMDNARLFWVGVIHLQEKPVYIANVNASEWREL